MQEKINIENYEAFLLDYVEGRLSEADQQALFAFLKAHPEIDAELELEEGPEITTGGDAGLPESFKSSLKREESTQLPLKDHLMIASVEGQLSKSEETQLQALIEEDEALLKELSYYQQTKLKAAKEQFPNKAELMRDKKVRRIIPLWAYTAAAAASILAFIFFNAYLKGDQLYQPRSPQYTDQTPTFEEPEYAFEVADEVENEAEKELPKAKSKLREQKELPSTNYASLKKNEAKPKLEKQPEEPIAEVEVNDDQLAAEVEIETDPKTSDSVKIVEKEHLIQAPEEQIAETKLANQSQNNSAERVTKSMTPSEYAKKVIQEDVLKNKSLSQALLAEVSNITNDKVRVELDKKEDDSQQFALNIGNFKLRKK